jgi:hypothetical protein
MAVCHHKTALLSIVQRVHRQRQFCDTFWNILKIVLGSAGQHMKVLNFVGYLEEVGSPLHHL